MIQIPGFRRPVSGYQPARCVVFAACLIGLCLLLGPLPVGAQDGTTTPPADATPQPMMSQATDIFARPTLPAQPSQADLGGQVYWLRCMVCHGQRGQGLTDEFRAAWPKVDQNCWRQGCHVVNRGESGIFSFPKTVPPVIGPSAIAPFASAADLHKFIAANMPYQAPGTLSDEVYWQLTAYLARANGVDPGRMVLDPQTAPGFTLHPAARPRLPLALGLVVGVAVAAAAVVIMMLRRQRVGR
jgi:hypothetical protein